MYLVKQIFKLGVTPSEVEEHSDDRLVLSEGQKEKMKGEVKKENG